jgi:hypothetical protein
MNTKSEMLALLQSEFDRWEQLLNTLSVEQITVPNFVSSWSIKDTLAHLMAWQVRSIARLEAATLNREPEFPRWPLELDPDFVENPDQLNTWLFQLYHAESWPAIHRAWQAGFQHFLKLARALPENDLLDPQRFPWMNGQPLMLVLQSSYDHHHLEHLDPLLARLQQSGLI